MDNTLPKKDKNTTNIIKQLTYNRLLRKVARFFNLSNLFRKLYFYIGRPRDGILRLESDGLKSQFYVKTPGELRILESMGGGGSGEGHVFKALFSSLVAGDTFCDIGGHVGLYSVFLAQTVGSNGKVITFEPEKQNYAHLMDNIRLNNLTNVMVLKKALGEKNEMLKLYLREDNGNSSLLNIDKTDNRYEEVEVVNGDQFIKSNNLPIPNAFKIDVEGYEYHVMNGLLDTLSRPECRLVCCEVHTTLLPEGINANTIIDLLKSVGFNDIDTYTRDSEYHVIARK